MSSQREKVWLEMPYKWIENSRLKTQIIDLLPTKFKILIGKLSKIP